MPRPSFLLAAATGPAAPPVDSPGYLAPGAFDVTGVLEPAPQPGDARYAADRAIFRATRRLVGTPRWRLATADVDYRTPALLRDFSCAAGATLTPAAAPRLVALLGRATADTAAQTLRAKEAFRRSRPFLLDQGPICQPQAELFDRAAGHMSYDYPSGHTTLGWTYALILAALAPDRAREILARGRAYGDSRFLCGAHNESAVEAGFLSASATMAVVAAEPRYQADLAAARAELAGLRATAPVPAPADCAAEAALTAVPMPAPPPSNSQ